MNAKTRRAKAPLKQTGRYRTLVTPEELGTLLGLKGGGNTVRQRIRKLGMYKTATHDGTSRQGRPRGEPWLISINDPDIPDYAANLWHEIQQKRIRAIVKKLGAIKK